MASREVIGHDRPTLKYIIDNFSHTHGVNPDGHRICFACMATLLLKIHDMVMKDASVTPDGRIVFTQEEK